MLALADSIEPRYRALVLLAAAEALRRHMEHCVEPAPGAFLFTGPGGGPLRRASLYKAFWTGASTKELMARLGHASPRAALRYQHAAATRDHEIARRLDEIFKAVRG